MLILLFSAKICSLSTGPVTEAEMKELVEVKWDEHKVEDARASSQALRETRESTGKGAGSTEGFWA